VATRYPSAPPVYVVVGASGLAEEYSNNARIYRDPSSWRCGHYYGQGDTQWPSRTPITLAAVVARGLTRPTAVAQSLLLQSCALQPSGS